MTFSSVRFLVDDVPATVDFYRTMLGPSAHTSGNDGAGSRLSVGGTTLIFARRSPVNVQARGVRDPEQGPQVEGVQLEFTVDNIAATYQRAIDSGATPVSALTETGVGHWTGSVRDRNGFVVELHSPPLW